MIAAEGIVPQSVVGAASASELMQAFGSDQDRLAIALGHAVQILFGTERRSWRIASVQQFLLPPVRLGQILFVYNSHGTAIGFATWAYLDPIVSARRAADPAALLDISEWNEGTDVWIMDIVAPHRSFRALRMALREQFRCRACVHWISRTGIARSTIRPIVEQTQP